MWGILRTSVKNHTEVKNMVGKHRSDYAAAMTALAMWAMGDCWSSKNELRKQIKVIGVWRTLWATAKGKRRRPPPQQPR